MGAEGLAGRRGSGDLCAEGVDGEGGSIRVDFLSLSRLSLLLTIRFLHMTSPFQHGTLAYSPGNLHLLVTFSPLLSANIFSLPSTF